MSAKYKRIKQADEALPAPLRWLTRAFSSITLSVILLSLVALYGTLGSVPVYFMCIGALWLVSAALVLGGTGWLIARFSRASSASGRAKAMLGIALAVAAIFITVVLCALSIHLVDANDYLRTHKATVVYRLPALEMNEPEFFAWWPFQLVLMLFVVNMVWATIRRIEFSIPRLGVLTVHTGIVIMALGAVFYSQLKLEGDMFIIRADLPGGRPVSHFYDRNMPALYVSVDNAPSAMFPLPELPRYNDYADGQLDIRLHERPDYADKLGDRLRITIPGFISYGEFERVWVPPPPPEAPENTSPTTLQPQPVLTVAFGDAQRVDDGPRIHLPAERPAERVLEQPGYAVEFLSDPLRERLDALLNDLDAPHVLVVDIPGSNFKQAYAITPGTTSMPAITLGLTGYTLTVEEVGPYTLPFVTEGYEGASDTQVTVTFQGGVGANAKNFRRIVMHRYPERSQDFSDGQRSEPDPAIRLTYLDNTKTQVRLVHTAAGEPLRVLLRVPGFAPALGPLLEGKVPLPSQDGGLTWLHVVDRLDAAVPAQQPVITPRARRDPKLEGTYEHALVPVRFEYDLHDENLQPTGETFSRLVWLKQMPYLEQPGGDAVPRRFNIPGLGTVEVALGRQRFALPFAVAMTDFTMTPYAGSTIPRDFESRLLIYPVDEQGRADGTPDRGVTRLNNPVVYRAEDAPLALGKIKLSQAGWDPGDPQTSAMAKEERDENGRYVNQQRFTILGVGNNVGIRVIALGAVLMSVGIPYAFYVKPWLLKRKARKLTRALPKASPPRSNPQTKTRVGKTERTPELVAAEKHG